MAHTSAEACFDWFTMGAWHLHVVLANKTLFGKTYFIYYTPGSLAEIYLFWTNVCGFDLKIEVSNSIFFFSKRVIDLGFNGQFGHPIKFIQ